MKTYMLYSSLANNLLLGGVVGSLSKEHIQFQESLFWDGSTILKQQSANSTNKGSCMQAFISFALLSP
ncbi:hypothetical protein I79_007008 [Cricetulus griseus]|uniref:Uncharacterized protein n=1 Tax=Cricetulus griseus TaxID=10029 RepID=G3H9E0_CRIGR|nr:hypothetical protein I79_007008 [Cricetulus griseus]